MEAITIRGKLNNSRILVDQPISNIKKIVSEKNVLIITDKNVDHYYASFFESFKKIVIDSGELSKTVHSIIKIYTQMINLEVDRSWFILGVGGGVVTDITGFIASTYMRGVKFGFVSTSLLGQVDASLGGKNGINFDDYKNIIGTINQPEFVICDINLLKTLPAKEIQTGLAEVIKYALMADKELLGYLIDNHEAIVGLENSCLRYIVIKAVTIKANIVNSDEHERSERKKLNFGHTFGHAIERISDYNHGESISIGMCLALELSSRNGFISKLEEQKAIDLLKQYKLPTNFSLDVPKITSAIKQDKKRVSSNIDFVYLSGLGNAIIKSTPIKDLTTFLEKL